MVTLIRVFERYTERARQVVVLAQYEARTLRHDYIGTEHILLGLLREDEGLAAEVLEDLDVTVEHVRAAVVATVGTGEEVSQGHIPFTPRAKDVLRGALRESLGLGHDYIGTEHLLLALSAESGGVATQILRDCDASEERIRAEVLRAIAAPPGGNVPARAQGRFRPARPIRHRMWRNGRGEATPDHAPLSGWRAQAAALAALGAASLSRRAFSVWTPAELDPIALRVLLAVGLTQSSDDAASAGQSRDHASLMSLASCDAFELHEAINALLANGLIERRPVSSDDPNEADSDWLTLTDAGAANVEEWLHEVTPQFTAWPPDRPDVDDAR